MSLVDILEGDLNSIPLPSPEFFEEIVNTKETPKDLVSFEFEKHGRAYEAYCKWIALPEELRKPTTTRAFEKRWGLPVGYAYKFRQQEDFQQKRMKYFWEWLLDKLPNVAYSVYKEALKGKSKQADILIELIAKHINIQKPPQTIQTLNIIGVSQDALNKLAVPKGYDKVLEGEEVKKDEKGGDKT